MRPSEYADKRASKLLLDWANSSNDDVRKLIIEALVEAYEKGKKEHK